VVPTIQCFVNTEIITCKETEKLQFLLTSDVFRCFSDLAIYGYAFLPILANFFVKFGYDGFLNLATLAVRTYYQTGILDRGRKYNS